MAELTKADCLAKAQAELDRKIDRETRDFVWKALESLGSAVTPSVYERTVQKVIASLPATIRKAPNG